MSRKITTEIFLSKLKERHPHLFDINDYSKTFYEKRSVKITVICKQHGDFQVYPGDHLRGMSGCGKCISNKRKQTNIEKYGVENYFHRVDLIQEAFIKKYGVKNPGLLDDHVEKMKKTNLERYGEEWSAHAEHIQIKRRNTNLEKYGVPVAMMNKDISNKSVKNKIMNGGFTKSNSSMESTQFIKKYIKNKNYLIEQCAYADTELGLHEWGIYYNGKWKLFDLVVFEIGHRGNKDKIIEILEYHGPFHYTKEDVEINGSKKAYPWKSNKTTIAESFANDQEKELLGKSLTTCYNIIWSKSKDL